MKNLKQAIEEQLQKLEIQPTESIISKYQSENDVSPERVSVATLEVLQQMGLKELPPSDLMIEVFLNQKGKPDTLGGKEI